MSSSSPPTSRQSSCSRRSSCSRHAVARTSTCCPSRNTCCPCHDVEQVLLTERDMTSPAIEGWFTTGPSPALLGSRCTSCGTVFFPPTEGFCKNPACSSEVFEEQPLSRRGRVWSYTDAQYQPPPPYIAATDPYE